MGVSHWFHDGDRMGARTERTTDGRLGHIPLDNVVLGDAGLAQGVDGAGAAPAKGADDDDAGHTAGLPGAVLDRLLDVGDQRILVGIAGHAGEGLAVVELPGPDLESERGARKAGMEAKGLTGRLARAEEGPVRRGD